MSPSPLINIGINLRSGENGFIVEVASNGGEGTSERLFTTYGEAVKYIAECLQSRGALHGQILAHVEQKAKETLSIQPEA